MSLNELQIWLGLCLSYWLFLRQKAGNPDRNLPEPKSLSQTQHDFKNPAHLAKVSNTLIMSGKDRCYTGKNRVRQLSALFEILLLLQDCKN